MILLGVGIFLGVIAYLIGIGATFGYGKHRWPSNRIQYGELDERDKKYLSAILWPFYWIFIWPLTKTNETVFESIEKHAALQVVKNKTRIADLHATRIELEKSNKEVENAEVELEKEMAKMQ